jgi:hypothetical protein
MIGGIEEVRRVSFWISAVTTMGIFFASVRCVNSCFVIGLMVAMEVGMVP